MTDLWNNDYDISDSELIEIAANGGVVPLSMRSSERSLLWITLGLTDVNRELTSDGRDLAIEAIERRMNKLIGFRGHMMRLNFGMPEV